MSCNCNDFPISCAPHAPGGDCHHHHGCPPHPCPPPDYKGGTSMYIGARYVPIFADPVTWDNEREYEPLTIVVYNGDMYTSKCYVPKGAALPEYPETQTKYWVKTADYNYQFADLKKTVNDLSRLVEQFQQDNEKFTELINGWNDQVKAWEAKMTEWQGQVDDFAKSVSDLTAKLDEEINRAKAAEEANKAAIEEEVSRAKDAENALQEGYLAGDAAEKDAREKADASIREDFTAADSALSDRIDAEQARAEGEETAIRAEFAAADTALSNRITSNKTDIDAIKVEQTTQNTNIAANAKNIADNAAELAKHAERLTNLESNAADWDTAFPDTTIAQEVEKEKLARANADTALSGRIASQAADIEEVRDLANHKVDQTTFETADALSVKYTDSNLRNINTASIGYNTTILTRSDLSKHPFIAGTASSHSAAAYYNTASFALKSETDAAQSAADKAITTIGDWETDHPNQTISECTTALENELEATDAIIGDWQTEHPGKTVSEAVKDNADAIAAVEKSVETITGDLSGYVTTKEYKTKQAQQDALISAAAQQAENANDEVQKTNRTIGDWSTKYPNHDITYEVGRIDYSVTNINMALSNFQPKGDYVTTDTYTAGQAAQDEVIAGKATKGELQEMQNAVGNAQSTADTASSTAINAKAAADNAESTAQAALTAANSATVGTDLFYGYPARKTNNAFQICFPNPVYQDGDTSSSFTLTKLTSQEVDTWFDHTGAHAISYPSGSSSIPSLVDNGRAILLVVSGFTTDVSSFDSGGLAYSVSTGAINIRVTRNT